MVSRAKRGPIASWWWTVDRAMLALVVTLMVAGLVFSLAASPAMAQRLDYGDFHFVIRHAVFVIAALFGMVVVSLLPPRRARQLAFAVLAGSLVLMVVTLMIGSTTKGASRWIPVGPFKLQPSEFLKPAFVVACAWAFAEHMRRRDVPGRLVATGLAALSTALLMLQPDLGQTVLILAVWAVLFFMSGMHMLWLVPLAGLSVGGLGIAYLAFPHVTTRIDRFLTGSGDTFQVDRAHDAIVRGGWIGQGPGEGVVKQKLPDSHTDFIFAAMTEEFGIVVAIALVTLFAAVAWRGLAHAMREDEPFLRFAITGLTLLFAAQATINVGVNLQLLPAKGMTLPFVSYGGSSLVSSAFAMGLLLAFTRRRAANYARPTLQQVPNYAAA